MSSIYFPLCGLLISLTINIIYFTKPRIKTNETKLYSRFIILTLLESLLACIIIFIAKTVGTANILYLLNRLDYILILLLMWTLFVYVFHVSFENTKASKRFLKYLNFFNIIVIILIFIFDVQIINEKEIIDTAGTAMNIVFSAVGVYSLLIIITIISSLFRKYNKVNYRKYIPLFILVVLTIFSLILRTNNPTIVFESLVFSYVGLIMFHTIENPDMKMINELNIAKDTAERANNFKTEFLSNMSHEVRTPLNAIVGFSESLTDENLSTTASESVNDIVIAANNLLEIVNSILDISKIEANKIEIVNTDYSTEVLIEELISLTKGKLMDKPLEFRTSFDSNLPKYLHGDHQRLKQVIVNLLTNSVKYTKEGYIEFKINCVQVNDICRLIISVEDSGMGIKPEKIDKLFTKFERLDVQNNTTAEGTGLGLAIAKTLVDLMGGKIVCQSVYRKGSRFTVAVNQKIVTGTPVITNQSSKKKTTLEIGKIDLSNKTILLVDDNVVNLKVASKLLQPYKVKTIEVTSGIECIELIKQGNKYDLILMDDMMPKMKGTEALHILKQDSSFNTPVVVLTANAIAGMREKYISVGFNDYLAKPIDRSELDRVIKEYLK